MPYRSLAATSRLIAACALLDAGCNEAEARPEMVVHVDMDMLLVSQLTDDMSQAALFDTLRIEVRADDAERSLLDVRQVAIGSSEDLPFSFGIASESGDRVHIRVRAFRAALATAGETSAAVSPDPVAVLDPIPQITVDRVVTLSLRASGVEQVNVTLHGECVGLPVRFGTDEITTCIDESEREASSTRGIADGPKPQTEAGTWWRAAIVPCEGSAPEGSRCVPGGLSIIGDPLFVARHELEEDALPARMTWLAPMFMDETEMTIGMLRGLIDNDYAGPWPDPKDPGDAADQLCTFDPSSADDMPINCLTKEAAFAMCAQRGGTVPTEAQWDHAARGRGRRLMFPWGNDLPDCWMASFGRFPNAGCDDELGLEPVKSHPASETRNGDVSVDGVADLAGSLTELTRDVVGDYDGPCWHTGDSGISENPTCDGVGSTIARGGAWAMPVGDLALPIRRTFSSSDSKYGFRCVFEATP